jgi:hypothetical protein
MGLPTRMTIASPERNSPRTRPHAARAELPAYTSTDIVGVEVGGAVKNVLAWVRAVRRLGFGANTRVALITRGLPRSCGWACSWRAAETFMDSPSSATGAHQHRQPVAQPPLRRWRWRGKTCSRRSRKSGRW